MGKANENAIHSRGERIQAGSLLGIQRGGHQGFQIRLLADLEPMEPGPISAPFEILSLGKALSDYSDAFPKGARFDGARAFLNALANHAMATRTGRGGRLTIPRHLLNANKLELLEKPAAPKKKAKAKRSTKRRAKAKA